MNTVLIVVYVTLSIISFLILFFISSKQKTTNCKLEKISIFAYTIILELIWFIMFNTILFFINFSVLKLLFAASLCFILSVIINNILSNKKINYTYKYHTFSVSFIILIEVSVLTIYRYYRRFKNFIVRTPKRIVYLIPLIIIELIAIYIFSLFVDMQNKEWEIFELIFTSIVITAFINIYSAESTRHNNLKWQYTYYCFLESKMYNYISKLIKLIGIDSTKCVYIFDKPSIIINELKAYSNSQCFNQFIIENQNDPEKCRKFIEDISETFIYTLKEPHNEIISTKHFKKHEDYFYHNCIEETDKLKSEILLANIYDIVNVIQKRLPDIIHFSSSILSLINAVWDEDKKYSDRIRSILEETKKS